MKTLKDFTPEIQAKIPEYIERYTKGVFDGVRYNSFVKGNAEALINWNYEKCGYKKPDVLVAENLYESQLFFNYEESLEKQKHMFKDAIKGEKQRESQQLLDDFAKAAMQAIAHKENPKDLTDKYHIAGIVSVAYDIATDMMQERERRNK